jgi:GGDEF domain-containing protein
VEVLKKEVYIDPLTQINNRKRFFQYYDSAISEAEEVV